MYRESLPTTERLEFDPVLRSEWSFDQRVRTHTNWSDLHRALGHVAINGAAEPIHMETRGWPYLRQNDRLSADDIRELESYFEFLRQQYGIPTGASVFPKRDAPPVAPIEKEDDDGA
jgi:hypothetical protein